MSIRNARLAAAVALALSLAQGLGEARQATATPPVPKPFPQPNSPPVSTTPAKPGEATPGTTPPPAAPNTATVAKPAAQGRPTESDLGVRVFDGADYLDVVELGKGQRAFLFGTNAPFADVVAFYKRERGGGRELFRTPPMQQFDFDVKFRDETMMVQPAVVVKDYAWNMGGGYVSLDGTQERHYKTIVQIVPAPVR